MSAFSTGYVKDTVASIGFLFSAFMIYFLKDLEDVRLLMVCILGIAFGMDALFTTFPSYHFEKIGHNIPNIPPSILNNLEDLGCTREGLLR